MKRRVLLVFACALALGACGVKSDLEKPTETAQKNDKDPSKPPSQLGK